MAFQVVGSAQDQQETYLEKRRVRQVVPFCTPLSPDAVVRGAGTIFLSPYSPVRWVFFISFYRCSQVSDL